MSDNEKIIDNFIEIAERAMTDDEIDYSEISFQNLYAWVTWRKVMGDNTLDECDVESVKSCFRNWILQQRKEQ